MAMELRINVFDCVETFGTGCDLLGALYHTRQAKLLHGSLGEQRRCNKVMFFVSLYLLSFSVFRAEWCNIVTVNGGFCGVSTFARVKRHKMDVGVFCCLIWSEWERIAGGLSTVFGRITLCSDFG